MPIYIDTNVYIDHFQGRADNLRPLGEFAFQLLRRALECEFDIVVSPLLLRELARHVSKPKINGLIENMRLRKKIIKVEADKEEILRAKTICCERGTDYNDTLHAILAQKANVYCLVTRNLKDFVELQDLVALSLPETL